MRIPILAILCMFLLYFRSKTSSLVIGEIVVDSILWWIRFAYIWVLVSFVSRVCTIAIDRSFVHRIPLSLQVILTPNLLFTLFGIYIRERIWGSLYFLIWVQIIAYWKHLLIVKVVWSSSLVNLWLIFTDLI